MISTSSRPRRWRWVESAATWSAPPTGAAVGGADPDEARQHVPVEAAIYHPNRPCASPAPAASECLDGLLIGRLHPSSVPALHEGTLV